MNYELRSPLTRLSVSLSSLIRTGETDVVDRTQADLHRLDALIGEILKLTRLQTPGGRKTETPANLRLIVENVAEDVRFEVKEDGKSVVISRADDCWLKGDPAASSKLHRKRSSERYSLHQTTDGGGSLTGFPQRHVFGAYPRCYHGDGVPPEALDRIFEPFYRVTEAREHQTGGTGLGLPIAQRIAIAPGASIRGRNRDGGGLEVEIRLPAPKPVSGNQWTSIVVLRGFPKLSLINMRLPRSVAVHPDNSNCNSPSNRSNQRACPLASIPTRTFIPWTARSR